MVKLLLIITAWFVSITELPNPNGLEYDYQYGAGIEANNGRAIVEATLERSDEDYYKAHDVQLKPYRGVFAKAFNDDRNDVNYQNLAYRFGSKIYVSPTMRTMEWSNAVFMGEIGIDLVHPMSQHDMKIKTSYQTNFNGAYTYSLDFALQFNLMAGNKGYYCSPRYKRLDRENRISTWSRRLEIGYKQKE